MAEILAIMPLWYGMVWYGWAGRGNSFGEKSF